MKLISLKKPVFSSIFLMVLLLIFFSYSASAHSPSNMKLSYNNSTKELDVEITHQVSNPETHYIYNIVIKINGETKITKEYASQPGSIFTYTYEGINASKDDVIQVTASCNQGGSITKELIVSSEGVSETGGGSSTPGFELIIFIVSILAVIMLVKKR